MYGCSMREDSPEEAKARAERSARKHREMAERLAKYFGGVVSEPITIAQIALSGDVKKIFVSLKDDELVVEHRGYQVVVPSDAPLTTLELFKNWSAKELTHARVYEK